MSRRYNYRKAKSRNKKIIFFIIAVLIFVGIIWANNEGYFKSLSEKMSESVQKSSKSSCEELLPDYLLSSDLSNEWGVSMGVRKGNQQGENINYYYTNYDLVYSKDVINDKGFILGTTKIVYSPALNKINLVWEEELDHNVLVEGVEIVDEEINYLLSWDGLSEEALNILGVEGIRIDVKKKYSETTFCSDVISSESGEYSCEIDKGAFSTKVGSVLNPEGHFAFGRVADVDLYRNLEVTFSPNIFRNELYEIIDYRIKECELV